MSIFPDFLRSVLLTMVLSFLTPILVISFGLASSAIIGCLPFLETIGQFSCQQILQFLATFGSGHPLQGSLIIGITCSLVGGLFDTYASYQSPRSQ
ncbi:hypothetical protein ACL6C3_08290 [Capilliphycus salinus ALCB114379]|uniref:hypothetical protein n=1 Tax=Capilliphycus salinus TaxID=2768948 RepID=UPI0039A563DE